MFLQKRIHFSNQKGFTLIELLIAMVIIAILSVIGFSAYGTLQSKARDQRRKDDLKKIAISLELYHAKYNRYPKDKCCQAANPSLGNPLSPSVSVPPPYTADPLVDLPGKYPNQPFWLKDTAGLDPPDPSNVVNPQLPYNQQFINEMPIDPLRNNYSRNPAPGGYFYDYPHDPDHTSYGYHYWTPSQGANLPYSGIATDVRFKYGETYVLWAKLENANDPDACGQKHYKSCIQQVGGRPGDMCDGTNPPTLSPNMYIITMCQ